jgi:hypothetical protein
VSVGRQHSIGPLRSKSHRRSTVCFSQVQIKSELARRLPAFFEDADGKMKADEETRKRIVEIGIRKVARETGINRETVALVANDGTVKPRTKRKLENFLAKRAK